MPESASSAVFLSYASQDAAAVARIAEALRAAGVEVWFDQNELVGGDAWDKKIRQQIKECAIFVPVISANTQARPEGYFRLEWLLAVERSRLMSDDHPFLFPVVIDDTTDAAARVPDRFRDVQWTRLNVKDTPESLAARVAKVLGRRDVSGVADPVPASTRPATAQRKVGRRVPAAAWLAALVFALGLASFVVWRSSTNAGAGTRPPTTEKSAATSASAVAEFPRDPDLKRAQKLLYTLDAIPEDLALADDLVKPLLASRPNDPEVVTVAAEISQAFLTRGFDQTQPRRAQAQRLAERAVQLAPDNPEALGALALYLWFTKEQLGRAEELARRAIELNPKEARFHRTLYAILATAKRDAEADAMSARVAAMFPDDPLVAYGQAVRYTGGNNFAAAEEWLDKTLALAPVANAITGKAQIMLEVHGDVDGMRRVLDRMPERQRTNARLVNTYAVLATVTGQTGPTRRLLDSIADTWLADGTYVFPKAMLVAELDEIDGNTDVARLQYEAALKEVRSRLAADPTDLRPARAELWIQLGLGHRDEARAALRLNLQRRPTPYRWNMNFTWWTSALRACLLLDERAEALTLLKEATVEPTGRLLLRNLFHVDPKMAPFRDDPEIAALLAEPKKEISAAPAAKTDEKSVAVLAFDNRSDDKDAEYFSDGISEELINALGRVPGLTVKGRTSAFFFKGKNATAQEIAEKLGVNYLVRGSVRKAGGKVRITAQLSRAATDEVVWTSESLERDLKDVFAVQDEIAGLIAKNLSLKLGASSAAKSIDPEAYRLFLAGRAQAERASNASMKSAADFFQQAITLEPNYAEAWAQLVRAKIQLVRFGGLPMTEGFSVARSAMARAVALEPDSPEVLVALGWMRRTADWDWRGAEQAFRRALELRPNHADTLGDLAVLMFNVGRMDEGLQLARRSVSLDPLNAGTQLNLSQAFRQVAQFTEAEQALRRAIQLAPQGQKYRGFLARSLVDLQRFDEAEREANLETDELTRCYALGLLATSRGRNADALAYARAIEKLAEAHPGITDYYPYAAYIYARVGESDRAFAALELARAAHDTSVPWMKVNYDLRALHADPRWNEFLKKVGLADEQLK